MSESYVWIDPPDRCANYECDNKPDEGRFVHMVTRDEVVGGKRRLSLHLCSPCAEALKGLMR